MASVIPVRKVMEGGMAIPGFTSVSKVERTSPPRTLTAPISVISDDAGDPPVVSRSRTTKVTSDKGRPRSSKDRWRTGEAATFPRVSNTHSIDRSVGSGPGRSRTLGGVTDARLPARYRCTACGNLTRFDVTVTRTERSFYHYSIGGELHVDEREVVVETVDAVSCRWCGHGRCIEPVGDGRLRESEV